MSSSNFTQLDTCQPAPPGSEHRPPQLPTTHHFFFEKDFLRTARAGFTTPLPRQYHLRSSQLLSPGSSPTQSHSAKYLGGTPQNTTRVFSQPVGTDVTVQDTRTECHPVSKGQREIEEMRQRLAVPRLHQTSLLRWPVPFILFPNTH